MLQCLEYKCVVALPLACHGSSKYLIRLLEELWRTCGSVSRGLLYTWSQCFHLIGLFYSELPDMIWPLLWSAVAWKSLTLRLCSTGSRSSGKTIFVHITAGLGWRLTVEMISAHKKTYLTHLCKRPDGFFLPFWIFIHFMSPLFKCVCNSYQYVRSNNEVVPYTVAAAFTSYDYSTCQSG